MTQVFKVSGLGETLWLSLGPNSTFDKCGGLLERNPEVNLITTNNCLAPQG